MGKSIKLVTLVGDEEVVVGRCHPGQARILRKNGLAEWKKGRLVLHGTSSGKSVLSGEIQKLRSLMSAAWPDSGESEWKGYGIHQKPIGINDTSWMQEIEEIDPEGLLMTREWSGSNRTSYGNTEQRKDPEEVRSETFADWVREAISRRDAGHSLLVADDPKRLMLGFVDDDTNEVLYVPLRKMKEATEEDLEGIGATKDELRTQEGRAALLGVEHETWKPVTEPDPDLEALWVQEVEDTLGAEIREAEQVKLADEWAKKRWDVEEVREALGLKPREEYLSKYEEMLASLPDNQRQAWPEGRRSGRTTEMCLAAATAALNGTPVFVKGHRPSHTSRLVNDIRAMTKKVRGWKDVAPINAWCGPGFDGALFVDPGSSIVEDAMAPAVTGGVAPEAPFYYRDQRIMMTERPPGAQWKGNWMVWTHLDKTHHWTVGDLSAGLEKAKAAIDAFYAGADDG